MSGAFKNIERREEAENALENLSLAHKLITVVVGLHFEVSWWRSVGGACVCV